MTRCTPTRRQLAGVAQLLILLGSAVAAKADPPDAPQVAEPATSVPAAGAQADGAPVAGVVARLEARRDRSNQAVFASEDGLRQSRTTFAMGVLYTFSQPGR
jgi:predicted outer membrane protein